MAEPKVINAEWAKLTPRQEEVITYWLLNTPPEGLAMMGFGGSVGGGKSFLLSYIAKYAALAYYPGIRVLIGRRELSELIDTTIRHLLDQCEWLSEAGPELFKHDQQARIISIRLPQWPKNVYSEIHYHPLADIEKIKGREFGIVLIDEADGVPDEVASHLITRLRQKLPKAIINDDRFPQKKIKYLFLCASNPNRGSWFEKWFYRKELPSGMEITDDGPLRLKFIQSRAEDNPHLPANYVLNMALSMDPEEFRRYAEGSFDVVSNSAYSEFRMFPADKKSAIGKPGHIWPGTTIKEMPEYVRVIGGIDMGGAQSKAHYTGGVIIIVTRANRWIVVDEFASRGPTVQQDLINWMIDMQEKWAKPIREKVQWRASKDQHWFVSSLRPTFHIVTNRGTKDAREQNVTVAQQMFVGDLNGIPLLFVAKHCQKLIDQLMSYQRDPKNPGKFIRKNDDVVDAFQYALEVVEKRAEDPALFSRLLGAVRKSA